MATEEDSAARSFHSWTSGKMGKEKEDGSSLSPTRLVAKRMSEASRSVALRTEMRGERGKCVSLGFGWDSWERRRLWGSLWMASFFFLSPRPLGPAGNLARFYFARLLRLGIDGCARGRRVGSDVEPRARGPRPKKDSPRRNEAEEEENEGWNEEHGSSGNTGVFPWNKVFVGNQMLKG